jgi:cell division protein FtsL
VLLMIAVPVVGMTMSALLIVFMRLIVFSVHSDLSQIQYNVQNPKTKCEQAEV